MSSAPLSAPARDARPARALSMGHFRRVAAGGFGDGRNSYAYGYAWYDGHVYIGTNRDLLVMAKTRFRYTVPSVIWPVEVPTDFNTADRGGQIWRYNPQTDVWQCVYRSPIVAGLEGRTVPLAAGFRNLCVFQGRSDPRPALYTIPSCGSFGKGPVMLRSIDGVHFEPITEQGMGLGDPNVTAFRSLLVFQDRLFTTPAGSRGGDPNVSYFASILCTEDPLSGRWERTNVGSFGDPTNYGIYDMCVAGDWLYAGTMNIREGCQLWKTRAEGKPPFHWVKVFDRGADRGILNQGVVCLCAYGDAVYLGTGIQNGGFDRVNNVGPDAAEVIRVFPDDTWELVAGTPRMTRQGLKVPVSGLTAGFGNPFAGYVWRMCAHEGAIYVGTYDGSSMLRYAELDARAQRIFDPATMEHFMRFRGGCELWRSADGNHWSPVTRNGFGNPNNWGIRTLLSTPAGLFVGTANPFGPRSALRGIGGWRYEDNPQGGIEVWHGAWQHAGPRDRPPSLEAEREPVWVPDATSPPGEQVLALPELGGALREPAGVEQSIDRSAWLDTLWDEAGRLIDAGPLGERARPSRGSENQPRHTVRDREQLAHEHFSAHPNGQLSRSSPGTSSPLTGVEDALSEYYLGTELRNTGYWREETQSAARAARLLVEELLALVPADTGAEPGAESAPRHGSPERVLVIGRGGAELSGLVAARWPGCTVTTWGPGMLADPTPESPTTWPLASQSVDRVVWIEGPWCSGAGEAGIREALRILRPGGLLVASDLVGAPREAGRPAPAAFRQELGSQYYPAVLARYRQELLGAGFEEAETHDLTYYGWLRFCRHNRQYFITRLLFHHLDQELLTAVLGSLPGGNLLVAAHVACLARKSPRACETALAAQSAD